MHLAIHRVSSQLLPAQLLERWSFWFGRFFIASLVTGTLALSSGWLMKLPETETSAEEDSGGVGFVVILMLACVIFLTLNSSGPISPLQLGKPGGSSSDSSGIICDDIISDDKHAILPCRCSLVPFP